MLFNDLLGTTLGSATVGGNAFDAIKRTAFGETGNKDNSYDDFFTGKPYVGELGYAFMFRNYRADKGKWQTTDPLGYPDGFNNLAYGNNAVLSGFDPFGGSWTNVDFIAYYYNIFRDSDWVDTDRMGLTGAMLNAINTKVMPKVIAQIDSKVRDAIPFGSMGEGETSYVTNQCYYFGDVTYSFGAETVRTGSLITFTWMTHNAGTSNAYVEYFWYTTTTIAYTDRFEDPIDQGIELGFPYGFGHVWENLYYSKSGVIE